MQGMSGNSACTPPRSTQSLFLTSNNALLHKNCWFRNPNIPRAVGSGRTAGRRDGVEQDCVLTEWFSLDTNVLRTLRRIKETSFGRCRSTKIEKPRKPYARTKSAVDNRFVSGLSQRREMLFIRGCCTIVCRFFVSIVFFMQDMSGKTIRGLIFSNMKKWFCF